MRQLLVRIVFLIALVAGLTIAPVIRADGSSGSGTLSPGDSACVGPFYSNGNSIELQGQVTNGSYSPKWSIWWSADNTTYTRVFHAHAIGITQDILKSLNPELFPGYFQSCLNNDTGVSIDYTISIGPGQY